VVLGLEGKESREHSYVKVVGRWEDEEHHTDEMAMTIDYTVNGFKVQIGPIWVIEKQTRQNPVIEHLFMPSTSAPIYAGFYDILEWIDTYKDTDYYFLDMSDEREDNIGKDLYTFITELSQAS
jgi:hypothetical protein